MRLSHILIAIIAFGMMACSNNATNSDSKLGSSKIDITQIKKGDKIEGLTVTKVKYETTAFHEIDFKGSIKLIGDFYYEEFEDSYLFKCTSPTTLNTGDYNGVQPLYSVIFISNIKKLKKDLSKEQLEKLNQGKKVKLNIELTDFSCSSTYDKGMTGTAGGIYVQML